MSDLSHNNLEADAKGQSKSNLDLDNILVTEIGQFGKFQVRALVLAAITAVFAGWSSYEYIFVTARTNTRCLIPECDGPQPEWSPSWLPNAIPFTSSSSFDNCYRFGNTSSLQQVENGTCPSALFDTSTQQPCEKYVFQDTYSVVYDFGLACDEWRRSAIGAMRNFGLFFGVSINGYISDRWGRSVALSVASFNTAWIGTLRYFTNTYTSFMISEFLESLSGGAYVCVYVLFLEYTGPKYRVTVGMVIDTFHSIGYMTLGLIAWVVPEWKNLTLTLYAPQLLTISFFWIISESARWSISKGRFKDAEKLLKHIAKVNGKELSEKSIETLRKAAEEGKMNKVEEKLKAKEPWLIVQLFEHKRVLLRCFVVPMWWITTVFIRNGLSINAVNLSGNRYLNYTAVSAVAIPGYWATFFLMHKIGRKPMLIGAFWLCGACQIAYIFLPLDLPTASLTVYLIGMFAIAMVSTSLQVYSNELFPTQHRNSLYGYSVTISRIGAMAAPLTPAIGAQWFESLPYVLYAAFALMSGALVFLMPETFGTKLPDTLQEASEMSSKKNRDNK